MSGCLRSSSTKAFLAHLDRVFFSSLVRQERKRRKRLLCHPSAASAVSARRADVPLNEQSAGTSCPLGTSDRLAAVSLGRSHAHTLTGRAGRVVSGDMKSRSGRLNLQVAARSLTAGRTRQTAKVAAGDSGAATRATLKRDVTGAPWTAAGGPTLEVPLQWRRDVHGCCCCCSPSAASPCEGIKGGQRLEGKVRIGQTAREERLALANERASPVHWHRPAPSACVI